MKINLTATIRRLLKNKTSLAINLTGLSVGMTAFIFIAFWIHSELNYDKFWQNEDQVYRVALTKLSNGEWRLISHTGVLDYAGLATP